MNNELPKTKIDESNIEYVKLTPTPTITSNNVDVNQNKQDEQNINTNDNSIDNVSNNIKENEDVIDSIKEHQEGVDIKNNDIDEWGITLTTSNVTPTSVTINCSQKDGQYVKELITGSFFCIQTLENNEWVDVPYKDNTSAFCWTAEAWIIPLNDTISWDINWDWVYGELPSGEYRIGKEIMNFKETGDYEETILYATFTIE